MVDANGNQVFRRISGFSAGIVERCKYNNVSIDRAFGRFITQTIDAAMQSMTRRVPVTEIRILASSLMVQRKTGGSLPVTLERLLKSDY